MVKISCLLMMCMTALFSWGQNLSMGIGARANNNWVQSNENLNFDIIDNKHDTLRINIDDNAVSLLNGLSFPIYARYTAKKNWWVQLNYGYEIWRMGINAFSTPSDYKIQSAVQAKMDALPSDYTSEQRADLKEVFLEDAIASATIQLESFERVQYNKLSLAIGSSLNRKGIVTFYYGGGFDFYTSSTFESYQGLVYDNESVSFLQDILEDLPKLESNIIAPFVNFGIEKQNIRFGFDAAYYFGPAFGQSNAKRNRTTISNGFSRQLIKSNLSVGLSLNYTLFNQNFNQTISIDKKNVLDPLVIGRYQEKPKLLQYGIAIDFPSFHNSGWSLIDNFELESEDDIVLYSDSLKFKNDQYLYGDLFFVDKEKNKNQDYAEILDYLYLEKQDQSIFINEAGEIDTVFQATTIFFDWGNINSIVKSPKINAFVRLNPFEHFSADLRAGYQNHTYGITAYETTRERIGEETKIQTRKLVYQENFHELSLGVTAYAHHKINNISKLGVHVGFNYNLWFNGKFQVEKGGINDSELLEDFHDYNMGIVDDDDDEPEEEGEGGEWNKNDFPDADKGVFTKKDYYDYTYNGKNSKDSYHSDFTPYLFDNLMKRSYGEISFGIDYYIENLKFNVYAERSIGRNQTMYSNLFSVGMGVALFLN